MLAVVRLEFHVDRYSLFLGSSELNLFTIFGSETYFRRLLCALVSIEFSGRHFFLLFIHFWGAIPPNTSSRNTFRLRKQIVLQRVVRCCPDERVGVSTERTSSNPNIGFRTIGSADEVA